MDPKRFSIYQYPIRWNKLRNLTFDHKKDEPDHHFGARPWFLPSQKKVFILALKTWHWWWSGGNLHTNWITKIDWMSTHDAGETLGAELKKCFFLVFDAMADSVVRAIQSSEESFQCYSAINLCVTALRLAIHRWGQISCKNTVLFTQWHFDLNWVYNWVEFDYVEFV